MGAQCAGGRVAGDESERGGWASREEAKRHCESSSVRSLAAPPAPWCGREWIIYYKLVLSDN